MAIGRLKEDYWKAAEAEYLKRLRRFADVEVREVKDEAALVKALPARRRTILLDERGECWTSDELAERLVALEEQHGGGRTLVLVIGGAEGVSPALRQEADQAIAFGRITLPHRFARVLLVEQLYRAFSILRGEPYHK